MVRREIPRSRLASPGMILRNTCSRERGWRGTLVTKLTMMATVAVDVWTRPCVSVAGTRWTLCTPASHFSFEYTESPVTSRTTFL
jgi:hypothetical protein